MLRSAKRHPEFSVSELTDHDGPWLENQLAGVSTERHRSSERGRVAADLAEKVESKVKVRAFRARRRMRQAVETLLRRTPTTADEKGS